MLRVGFNFLRSGTYNFDPRLYTGNNMSFFMFELFAPLAKVDPATLEYTPYLAESFEVVDPQTLQVVLRDDATFHDGRPVTAADAKASIEASKANQAEGNNNVSASIQQVQDVTVVDDRTFTVNFTQPAVLSMYEMMAGPEFLISPADAGAEQATNPIGNGPFKFVSNTQDQSFTLEKNPDFFDAESVQLAGLEYVNLAEGNPQVNGLLGGDIDVATDIGTEGMSGLEGRDDVEGRAVVDAIRFLYLTFCFAPGHVWEDPNRIQAVQFATDREQVAELLYEGSGAPLNQFYPKGHPYHDDALDEEYATDIDRAQQLADQSGLSGISDGMWATSAIPESEDLVLLLNEQWGEVGVALTPVVSDDLTGDALQPSKANPPTLTGGDSLVIENTRSGLQRLTRQIDPNSVVNTCNWSNERLTEIAGELAALAPDDPAAADLWKEASRIALEEGPFMILAQKPTVVGISTSVGGVEDGDFHGSSEGSYQLDEWFIKA